MEVLRRTAISMAVMSLVLCLAGCDSRMDYIEQLTQPSNKVKAAEALARYDDPETVKALLLALNDSDRKLRYAALDSLKEIVQRNGGKDPSGMAISPLSKIVKYDPDYKVRYAALEVLGASNDPSVDDTLIEVLERAASPRILRMESLKLLGERKSRKSEPCMIRLLQQGQDVDMRKFAAFALGELGTSDEAINALADILADPNNPGLRKLAREAIDKINERRRQGPAK